MFGAVKLLLDAQRLKSPKAATVDWLEIGITRAPVSRALCVPDGTGIGSLDYLCRAVAAKLAVAAQCRVEPFGRGKRVRHRRDAHDLVITACCHQFRRGFHTGSLYHPV
jgi:hypothetical protein